MTREAMRAGESGDRWTGLLSDYLDGELSPGERRALEDHLPGCAQCRAALEELAAVVQRAPALRQDEQPAADLWPGIEQRLGPRRAPRARLGALVPAWPAAWPRLWPAFAAAALVLAVAAGLVLPRAGRSVAPEQASVAEPQPPEPRGDLRPLEASREYYDTLAQLQQAARARLARDPRVVEVIEQNLEVLDMAIARYTDALAEQPGDSRLASRLEAARQRKIDVLQQAVDLAAEAGN
ncbi:MAG TPA: zf-HC2 domain-containing protein [Vicinamibacterales bacterium]|nr:zf-HC2 domain-containing protein [Vicinamibacterales bacterium]